MSFEKFYKNYEYKDEYLTLDSYGSLGFSNASYRSLGNGLIAFTTSNGKSVEFYNANTDSVVLTLDATYLQSYNAVSCFGHQFILAVERKNDVYSTKLYDGNGNLVATKNGNSDLSYPYEVVSTRCDLLQFNGCIYRVNKDGSTTCLISNPLFGDLPYLDYKTEDYYYYNDYDEVTVYDHDLNVVYYWEIPYDDYEEIFTVITSEDVIITQMVLPLPFDADKYDLFYEDVKYEVKSLAIDVESGKEKTLELDYVIYEIVYNSNEIYQSPDETSWIDDSIDNLAYIYPIVDKRLPSDVSGYYAAINGKNGKIEYKLFEEFGGDMPYPIANDRFNVTLDSGDTHLIDGNGKKIGTVNILNSSNSYSNEVYIIYDGKIYDYNLKLKYDFVDADKEFVMMLSHGVLLRQDSNYYIYTKDGDLKSINGSVSTYNCTKSLVISYNEGEYHFYNDHGEQLLNTTGSYASLITYDLYAGYCIVSVTKNSTVSYYRFYA